MYSYSSPFYVAQQKADNINPFSGYSTLTTYYENGEPLSASSNSLPTAEEILFLTSGFSLNCSLVQPTYYAYNISNVCENNMVLFANYSYKIPNSKLTDVTLTASVINNGNSILGLMYPRGLLQFQSLAVDISVDVSGYTITFQGQLAQCNAYFTVELQEGYNTLSSYQVVVSCLNYDPFFIYFQIPLNQEEKEIVANYTETLQSEGQTVNPQTINVAKLLNQTRDFSLLLIDSFQVNPKN